MNRIIIIILLLSTISFLAAEFNKGDILIGLDLQYSNREYEKTHVYQGDVDVSHRTDQIYDISLNSGYLITESIELGLGLSYYTHLYDYHSDASGQTSKDRTMYSFDPYLTKYFEISNKLLLGGTLSTPIGFGEYTYIDSEYNREYINLEVNFSPSVLYRIHPKLLVSLSMGSIYYRYQEDKLANIDKDNVYIDRSFGVDFHLTHIYWGLRYVIVND